MSQHRRRPSPRRRARHRVGALLTTAVVAIAALAGGVYFEHMRSGGFAPAAAALAGLRTSHSATLLEQERQQMILLDAASRTMKVVGAPKVATRPSPASPSGGSTGSTQPQPVTVSAPPPDPGTAQATAYQMLPSFGFSASSQYGCLNDIWSRESGWRYNAENASGAYGIPQALPGSKMASAGADWATDPATQIRWGLGYIKGTYGTPCDAWAFWEAHGWY